MRILNEMTGRIALLLLSGLFIGVGPVVAVEGVDIYQQDIPPMTTLECAKCHPQIFKDLRDIGGLHKQQCQDCHDKFHTFTPGVAWKERVPSCVSCHDLPHGEGMNDCLACHSNAHAPIESMVVAEELADMCERCHQPQTDELQQEGSLHAGQSCFDCHQGVQHGVRPECNSCHEGTHAEFIDNAGCVSCHPAHAPDIIKYGKDAPSEVCAGCHADQLQLMQASDKKHKALACIVCHAGEHKFAYSCQHCHESGPHNPTLLKNFSSCVDCHGDPHQLKL